MAKLFNTKTRKQEKLSEDLIEDSVKKGTHSFRKQDQVNIIDPKTKDVFSVAGSELRDALDQGFRLETSTQAAAREFVNENKGLSGATKVALGQFADEALLGLPELALDKTQDPLERAKREALKEEFSTTNALAGLAGFGASLFTGAPLFKGAQLAGKAVAKQTASRLGGKITEKQASNLLKKTAEKSVELGTEGVILSAPRALTEAALGDIDAAADTLTQGAAFGAILGSAFPTLAAAGKGTKDLIKLGKKKTGDMLVKKLNEEQSALNIIGASAAKAERLKQTAGDVIDELPNFLRRVANEDKTALLSGKKLFTKVNSVKDDAAKTIDESLTAVDDTVERLFQTTDEAVKQELRAKSFNLTELQNKLHEKFIVPNEALPGFGAQTKSVKKFIDDIDDFIKTKNLDDAVIESPKKLVELRRKIDDLINFEKDPLKRTMRDEALHFARKDMQDFLTQSYIPNLIQVAPELKGTAERLLNANKNFRISSQILPLIGKKIDKQAASKLFGFREIVGAAAGAGGFGLEGLAAGAAIGKLSKFADEAFDVAGILFTEKRMGEFAKRLDKIGDVVRKPVGDKGLLSPERLNLARQSAFQRLLPASEDTGDRKENFKKVSEKLAELSQDVTFLNSKIAETTDIIKDTGAPETAAKAGERLVTAFNHIVDVMPKPLMPDIPIFKPRAWEPSDQEVTRFERRLEVVLDPLTVIKDLEAGSLTRDQMETLFTVYPRLTQIIQQKVIDELSQNPKENNFQDRLKLSLFLGADLDINLTPEYIQAYQSTFAEPSIDETETAVPNDLNISAENAQTESQKVNLGKIGE